jgi:cyanophycinase
VTEVRPQNREESADPDLVKRIGEATGIFMTGGNQLKLSAIICGTPVGDAVVAAHQRGVAVAGTSAGASIQSSHMVAFGVGGATPKQRMTQVAAGLGLLQSTVIDQHFDQRNRYGRLLMIVSQSPSLLGLGIDEDTAGVVGPDQVMEVIGRRSVTVVDGAASETDAWDVTGQRPLMVSNVVLHSLPGGYRFDLQRRTCVVAPVLRALDEQEAASS